MSILTTTARQLAQTEEAARQFDPKPATTPILVEDLSSFIAKDIKPRQVLLTPWLPEQGLAMIHAPRGIGKTYVALNGAYAIASGGEFLGWKAPRPQGVLVIDGEMPAAALQERLSAIIAASSHEAAAPFRIITPDSQPKDRPALNLSNPEDQAEIEKHLTDIALIIVDNISTLCRAGKENEAESWLPVQGWALRQRAAGRSVLFIHHSGKTGEQRGTSRREDVLDTVIGLKRPADYEANQGARFEVHYQKARGFYGDDAQPFEAMLTEHNGRQLWVIKTLEDSILEQVIELHKEGLSQVEIATEIGRHKSRVSRMLAKAKAEGRIDE